MGRLVSSRRHEYRGPEKTIDLSNKKFEDVKNEAIFSNKKSQICIIFNCNKRCSFNFKNEKKAMFNKDKIAAELTKIIKDPFDGQHLPIDSLKFIKDENTIRVLYGESDSHSCYNDYDKNTLINSIISNK